MILPLKLGSHFPKMLFILSQKLSSFSRYLNFCVEFLAVWKKRLDQKKDKVNSFFQKSFRNEAGRLVPELFLLFKKALYEIKASGLQISFNIFWQSLTWRTIKTDCIKLQTIDPEISSILIFQKTIWEQYLRVILDMVFHKKCFSCYTLLTDQI